MAALAGGETIVAARWLYGKLAALPGSTGAYPGMATRGAEMPYVIFQSFPRPDGQDVEALGSGRIMAKLQYLIKIVAPTLGQCEPIAKALDAALEGQGGQQDGYTIQNVRRVLPFELPTLEDGELYWQHGGYYNLDVVQGV